MRKPFFSLFYITIIIGLSSFVYAQPDTTPPQLVDFSFSPTSIDVSGGSASANITINATEDVSGIDYATYRFRSPSQQQWIYRQVHEDALISGDIWDGIYQGINEWPQHSEAGTWYVEYVILADRVGNSITWHTQDLIDMGFNTSMEVISTLPDTTPPQLVDFSFSPTTIDVNGGSPAHS